MASLDIGSIPNFDVKKLPNVSDIERSVDPILSACKPNKKAKNKSGKKNQKVATPKLDRQIAAAKKAADKAKVKELRKKRQAIRKAKR